MFAPEFCQDLLARLDSLESCLLLGRVRRNALDLLSVEDGVHAVNEPRFLGIRVVAGWPCLTDPVQAGMAAS